MATFSEEQIQKISELGSVWVSNDGSKRRVYFNDLTERMMRGCNVKIEFYNTGNVSSASKDGEIISNSDGKRWLASVPYELYFDLGDKNFHWQGGDPYTAKRIVVTIATDAGIVAAKP